MPEFSRHLLIENLSYQVGDKVLLDRIGLDSAADCCTALIGANGSGKTTLLKICHGLLTPTSGTVRWGDNTPTDMGRRITMVFQKPWLLRRSVRANLEYILSLYGFEKSEYEERISSVLRMVGLADKMKRNARLLSGGEQQRLALARAWICDPDVMLLDEPTAGLDLQALDQVENVIGRFKRQGVKVVFASHNLSQVRRLSDEVMFLHNGRRVVHSDTEHFFNAPQEKEVCEFMRSQAFC